MNGSVINEPPAIEGYLYRIRPNSQARSNAYLSTHNSNLFTLTYRHASPPAVPNLRPDVESTNGSDTDAMKNAIDPQNELFRGSEQVLHANGFIDLRDIVTVRMAIGTSAPSHRGAPLNDSELGGPRLVDIDHDNDLRAMLDQGAGTGAEGEWPEEEDEAMRVRRSFEMVMRTGTIIRLEVGN